jgi:predicted GH43/DUF377 family glycosyl hydrolase
MFIFPDSCGIIMTTGTMMIEDGFLMRIIIAFLIIASLPVVISCDFLGGGGWPYGWVKSKPNPVLSYGQPQEPTRIKEDPCVLYEDGVYKMWFSASAEGAQRKIYYAISVDGINWTVQDEPALDLGGNNQWDDEDVITPFVIKVNGIYHMYYAGRSEDDDPYYRPGSTFEIGHATSDDGLDWHKDPHNPVISLGDEGSYDGMGLSSPTVLYENGVFKLWYSAISWTEENYQRLQLAYASSSDGTHFTRSSENPLLSVDAEIGVASPGVVFTEGKYYAFFTEYPNGFPYQIGPVSVASSPNGLDWTIMASGILSRGYSGDFDETGVYSPCLLQNGSSWMMWYGGIRYDYASGEYQFGIGLATR